MALSPRQLALYVNTVDIWRPSVTVNAVDGTPGARAWTKIASAVQCYFEFTPSQFAEAGGILVEEDNIFTLDVVHFEASTDVKAADVLKITAGPGSVGFWVLWGNAEYKARLANKLSIRGKKLEKAPTGVS